MRCSFTPTKVTQHTRHPPDDTLRDTHTQMLKKHSEADRVGWERSGRKGGGAKREKEREREMMSERERDEEEG